LQIFKLKWQTKGQPLQSSPANLSGQLAKQPNL
jgi:hypothetical protein